MFEKIMQTLFIIMAIMVIILIGSVIRFIHCEQDVSSVEYSYKNFTEKDIDLAMKYHGTNSIIIKIGTQPYFIDSEGREIILFTDSCIEYLYKQKQKEVKNDRK